MNSLHFEFSKKAQNFEISNEILYDSPWIYCNEKQIGFYRVLYEDSFMIEKLFDHLMELDASERLGLQNDFFALSFANLIDISHAMQLASRFSNENSYAVWSDLSDNLSRLLILWEDEQETFQILKDLCKNIFTSKLHNDIGFEKQENDSDLTILLRSLLMKNSGLLGDEKTIDFAKQLFTQFINNVKLANANSNDDDHLLLSPDLQDLVFEIVISQSSSDLEWNQLRDLYDHIDSHEGKIRILKALASSKDPVLIKRALQFSISDHVKTQDSFYAFVSTSKSSVGRDVAWKFLKDHWDVYVEKFGDGQFLFPRIISYATKFHSLVMADEIDSFFTTHPVSFTRTLSQIQEYIHSNANWLKYQKYNFNNFLKDSTK